MSNGPPAAAWPRRHPPEGTFLWQWSPAGLDDLAAVRRDLRGRLTAPHDGAVKVTSGPAQDTVAALDELMSNALRHGGAPIVVQVHHQPEGYVLSVDDQSPGRPPLPTSDRDPARGGMGLGIIAFSALAHGWFTHQAVKTVWALLPRVTR